jgi:hypothetical protein
MTQTDKAAMAVILVVGLCLGLLATAVPACMPAPTVTPSPSVTPSATVVVYPILSPTATATSTPIVTYSPTPTPTETPRPRETVCPVATLMITCCVDADDDAKCASDDLPVYCVMFLAYDIGISQPVLWEVTAGAGGVAIVALIPGEYSVTIHSFTAIIKVAPDYRQTNTVVLNAGRDERVDVAFVSRVPIPTNTAVPVTPSATPTQYPCRDYWTMCKVACGAGEVVDVGGGCGMGVCCLKATP